MNPIFIFANHIDGLVSDSVFELISTARSISPLGELTAIACGENVDLVCEALRPHFTAIWKISSTSVSLHNPEQVRAAMTQVLPAHSIVLFSHEHLAIDLAPGLSVKLNVPYVPDIVSIESSGLLVRQEFNGQFHTRVRCDLSGGAVITVRPGAFKPAALAVAAGEIVDKPVDVSTTDLHRRYLYTIPAEAGDVDITKQSVLVSIGRGLQDKENIALAEELAELLGGAVSCSRPVVDAKWLDKSRQVGSSGATVSPKVYVACGISGSFQHMAGIKGSPYLVAINKNPAAPIFQFADLGIVDDVLEFLPILTEKIRATSAKSAVASH